jgi:putative photosynthetic complex assembly protein|tara:strand:- start:2951 stop:3394 length:444 start_codon:yes stop_codon:yes gene_type:complete
MKNILKNKLILKSSLPLFIVCSLILFVAFVAVFQMSDSHPFSISKQFNVKAEKKIALEISKNGDTLILDETGNVLLSYSKDQENFVSTVTKVLERDRKKFGITKNSIVVLRLSQKDRLSIYDPLTEREIDLAGFGKGNIQVFIDLLD